MEPEDRVAKIRQRLERAMSDYGYYPPLDDIVWLLAERERLLKEKT